MESLRSRLRAATAPHHQRVDAAFSAFPLEQIDGYRDFLRAHAQVVDPLEVALEASRIEAMVNDWPQRQRRHALSADLAELEGRPPVTESIPYPLRPGWCLGAAYVIEGSRLGGRVLAKRVASGNPSAPLRYLAGHGTTPSWAAFLEQLERHGKTHPWEDVQAGAMDTFERFLAAAKTQRP